MSVYGLAMHFFDAAQIGLSEIRCSKVEWIVVIFKNMSFVGMRHFQPFSLYSYYIASIFPFYQSYLHVLFALNPTMVDLYLKHPEHFCV
jgi:hypothetical protein